MAVILLFFLIQTYRFATISSMNMGEPKLVKCGLMIYLPANFFINRGQGNWGQAIGQAIR